MPTITNKILQDIHTMEMKKRDEREKQQRKQRMLRQISREQQREQQRDNTQPNGIKTNATQTTDEVIRKYNKDIDELESIQEWLCDELKKQKQIERILRNELDANCKNLEFKSFNSYEKHFMQNKKHCIFIHKFLFLINYAITRLFMLLCDIIEMVLENIILFSIIFMIMFFYKYPNNITFIIDSTIHKIDTGILNNYINVFRKYLIYLKNM